MSESSDNRTRWASRVGVAWAFALLVGALGCAPTSEEESSPSAALAVVGATLIDGTGGATRDDVTLLVEDGRITELGSASEVDVPAGARVLDARGRFVMPGLVDLHVHFGRGVPLPPLDDETAVILARQLDYGVTSILQLGATDGDVESIRALRTALEEGSLHGPHLYGSGGHLTLQGSHPVYTLFPPSLRAQADRLADATPLEVPVDLTSLGVGVSLVRTPEAARAAVRDRAAGGMDMVKITVESGPTPFRDDHPQMPAEMIRAIVEQAEELDLRVFAHVSSLDELEAVEQAGGHGVVHTVRNDPLPEPELIDRLAAAGFFVMPTLSLYAEPPPLDDPFLRRSVTAEEIGALEDPVFLRRVGGRWRCCAPFGEVLRSVGEMHRRGVPIVLGTDTGNPYIFAGYQVHRELELLVEAGLTPMEAIVAATGRAAEFLGRDHEFGTLEVGKRADLLILDANPVDDIRNTRTLRTVVRSGVVVDREQLRRSASPGPPNASESRATRDAAPARGHDP